jgi:hypothetical protein
LDDVSPLMRSQITSIISMAWDFTTKSGGIWQTRVRTLNGELSAILKRWYPDMDLEVEEMPVAA